MSITVHNLHKAFDGHVVLNGFSYAFPDTGLFALIGKSGEGKTTLLRILSGLTRADSGDIQGVAAVSVAFQEHRLIDHLTARQNISLVLFADHKAREKEVADMLTYLGLDEDAQRRLPSALSGGMKQRVSLCRAFLHDAPILLLDEPLKELDPALADRVLERIRYESSRRLVILTAHSIQDAARYGAVPISLGAEQ